MQLEDEEEEEVEGAWIVGTVERRIPARSMHVNEGGFSEQIAKDNVTGSVKFKKSNDTVCLNNQASEGWCDLWDKIVGGVFGTAVAG